MAGPDGQHKRALGVGPARLLVVLAVVRPPRHAKVANLGNKCAADQHISCGQVAVHEASMLEIGEPGGGVGAESEQVCGGEAQLGRAGGPQQCLEVAVRLVLEDQTARRRAQTGAQQPHHIAVVQIHQTQPLADEIIGGSSRRCVQLFHCNRLHAVEATQPNHQGMSVHAELALAQHATECDALARHLKVRHHAQHDACAGMRVQSDGGAKPCVDSMPTSPSATSGDSFTERRRRTTIHTTTATTTATATPIPAPTAAPNDDDDAGTAVMCEWRPACACRYPGPRRRRWRRIEAARASRRDRAHSCWTLRSSTRLRHSHGMRRPMSRQHCPMPCQPHSQCTRQRWSP